MVVVARRRAILARTDGLLMVMYSYRQNQKWAKNCTELSKTMFDVANFLQFVNVKSTYVVYIHRSNTHVQYNIYTLTKSRNATIMFL